MSGFLTRKWRWRATSLLVVLYAVYLLAPTAVLAFGTGTVPPHCVTDSSQTLITNHVDHGESGQDRQDNDGAAIDHASKCCGLFSVSGVMPATDFADARLPLVSELAPLFAASLSGQDSDRIDRPPRSLPSL